jgi:hypothetical protein
MPYIPDHEFERLSRIAQMAETLIRDPLLPQSPQQGRAYREISALFRQPENGPDAMIEAPG